MEFHLSDPTCGPLLGGHWADFQRAAYPRYYRKDGQLKWWAKRRREKWLRAQQRKAR